MFPLIQKNSSPQKRSCPVEGSGLAQGMNSIGCFCRSHPPIGGSDLVQGMNSIGCFCRSHPPIRGSGVVCGDISGLHVAELPPLLSHHLHIPGTIWRRRREYFGQRTWTQNHKLTALDALSWAKPLSSSHKEEQKRFGFTAISGMHGVLESKDPGF